MEHKLVGNHPESLGSGRMLEPGETVELSEEELENEHNKSLIADGLLVNFEEDAPDATEAAVAAADDLGVNLSVVEGTGLGGRITKEDVERASEEVK